MLDKRVLVNIISVVIGVFVLFKFFYVLKLTSVFTKSNSKEQNTTKIDDNQKGNLDKDYCYVEIFSFECSLLLNIGIFIILVRSIIVSIILSKQNSENTEVSYF